MKLIRGARSVRAWALFLIPACLLVVFLLFRTPPVPGVSRLPLTVPTIDTTAGGYGKTQDAPVDVRSEGNANGAAIMDDKAPTEPSSSSSSECERRYGTPLQTVVPVSIPGLQNADSGTTQMAVYTGADIVSNTIRNSRGWELRRTMEVLQHLSTSTSKKAVLLDIGANVGWFSLVAAYSGYEVVAVEPFSENRALFQRSLCLAPEQVRRRVTLVPYALGPAGIEEGDGKNTTCELWQAPSINRGDTVTTCMDSSEWQKAGFVKLAETQLRTFDSLLPTLQPTLLTNKEVDIVMKIDTEGFEPLAMMGMGEFMKQSPPKVIFTEFTENLIKMAGKSMGYSDEKAKALGQGYKDSLKELGYTIVKEENNDSVQDITYLRNKT